MKSYPVEHISSVQLNDETLVVLRPIHPIDGKQADSFRAQLSEESIYDRFLGYVPKISDALVKRLTEIDYSREMAIVAEIQEGSQKEIIAVVRIVGETNTKAEFAIIISDNWQGKGLGTIMTTYVLDIAKRMGFEQIYALVFSSNIQMLEILRHRGFKLEKEDELTFRAQLNIGDKKDFLHYLRTKKINKGFQ